MALQKRLWAFASFMSGALLAAVQPGIAETMALPGTFGVSTSGAATYTIPIAVPPGTAGLVPSLSLEYNSQSGDGIMGIGWSLGGLPSITRCPQTIAQDGVSGSVNFDANDRFCLEGQRLVVVSGSYGGDGAEYRTEIESFARIISHGAAGNGPAWFEVRTRTGQRLELGHSTDSLILAQGKNTARVWAVNKVSDTKGNYFTVSYTNDASSGQFFPIEIDYTGNASAGVTPYNKVQFVYATRPDILAFYQAGSLVQTPIRLTNVKTFAGATLVSDYRLAYTQTSLSNRSRLTSVTACDPSNSCLPPTTFSWPNDNGTMLASPVNWQSSGDWNGWSFTTADVNGDGRLDLVLYVYDSTTLRTWVALGKSDGTFSSPVYWQNANDWNGWSFTLGDVNGDGKSDVILYVNNQFVGWQTWVALSHGDGTFSAPVNWHVGGDWNGWSFTTGDVNGDGKSDLIVEVNNQFVGWQAWVALSHGDGTFSSPVNWTVPGDWNGWSFTTGDVNGDGKLDLIVEVNNQFVGWQVWVALSRGDGTFAPPINWTVPGDWNGWSFTTGDVNGDGKLDLIVEVNNQFVGWQAWVALSRGDGTFSSPVNWTVTGNWNGWSFTTGDVNGDGRLDQILYVYDSTILRTWVALGKSDGTFSLPVYWQNVNDWNGWSFTTGDVNGDGNSDLILQVNNQYVGLQTWTVRSVQPALQIASITTGLGATTSISYQPLTNTGVYSRDNTASYPMLDVQAPIQVVSRIDKSNGIGGINSWTYSYAGAKADLSGRGFLGFRQMTVSDLQTGLVETTTYQQNFPFIGLLGSVTRTSGSISLSGSSSTYGSSNRNNGSGVTTPSNLLAPYRVSLGQRLETGSDLDGTQMPATTSTFQYDAYGNATQVSVAKSDGYSKTTNNTYTNDQANWLLGRLTNSAVTSQAPRQLGQ